MPALSNREQVKYSMISYCVASSDTKAKTCTDKLVAGFVK